MKVAALIFLTHTHPCNIDMNINNIVVLSLVLWLYLFVAVFG